MNFTQLKTQILKEHLGILQAANNKRLFVFLRVDTKDFCFEHPKSWVCRIPKDADITEDAILVRIRAISMPYRFSQFFPELDETIEIPIAQIVGIFFDDAPTLAHWFFSNLDAKQKIDATEPNQLFSDWFLLVKDESQIHIESDFL